MMIMDAEDSDSSSLSLRRPPPSPDQFEFIAATSPAMCSAEDVFHRGQLLPYKSKPPLPHRRSESLDIQPNRRGGLAAEYRKLRRAASESAPPPPATLRPRWYVFDFGSVRVPAATQMTDIRSRLRRLAPPAAAAADGGGWWLLRSLSCKGINGKSVVVTAPLGYGR